MPQSLTLSTPPQLPVKRQRSQEPPSVRVPGLVSTGQTSSEVLVSRPDDSARQVNVRIPSYLNKSKAKIALSFQELEWKQRFRLQHGFQNPHSSPFRVDRSKTVFNRNRYGNVQPWDASRIKLKTPIGGSDYVNASPIALKSRAKKSPSDNSIPTPPSQSSASSVIQIESKYIATQGPKDGQFSHFWHMVMQETPGDVGAIIMLTPHVEGNKEKCAQYYPPDMNNPTILLPTHEGGDDEGEAGPPDDGDPFLDSPAGSADADSAGTDSEESQSSDVMGDEDKPDAEEQSDAVNLLSSHYDAKIGCEVRKLRLSIGRESKTIYHYYFGGWPDFAKPEAEDRAALLELTRVTKAVASEAPRIVHCSAGVGRTGTWIALDFLLQELEAGRLVESAASSQEGTPTSTQASASTGSWGKSGPPKASTPEPKDEEDVIWETVNTLREQRMMMVMNELQYQFIYEVIKDAFIDKYAEKETGPVVIEVQEPSPKVARKKSPSLFGGIYQGTKVGGIKSDEDTVSDADRESEAETEVMDQERRAGDADSDDSDEKGDAAKNDGGQDRSGTVELDPYAAVAPETIRNDQKRDEQGEGGVHD